MSRYYLLLLLTTTFLHQNAVGQDLTLQDLKDVVEQRNTSIQTAYLKYSVETRQMLAMQENAKIEAELSGTPVPAGIVAFVKPMQYELWTSGEKFAVAENDGQDTELHYAFDGETLSRFEPRLKLGSRGPYTRQDALNFVTTLTELSSPQQSSPESFFEAALKGKATVNVRRDGDGYTRAEIAVDRNVGGTLRTVAEINLTKGGWIENYRITLIDSPLLKEANQLIEACEVTDFLSDQGVWVPKTIKYKKLGIVKKVGEKFVCDILLTRNVEVEIFQANEPVDHSTFALEIPRGARFVNEVNGTTYVIQDDGSIKSLAESVGTEIVVPGEFENLGEAISRIQNSNRSSVPWQTLGFVLLLGLTGIIAWKYARRRL